MGGVVSPSRPVYWFHVTVGVVYRMKLGFISVMEKLSALISDISGQTVSPTRPLLVTVVCAVTTAGSASNASRKKVANLVRGGVISLIVSWLFPE